MARKESITKNDIINAAFAILQEEGIEQVTARKLAAKAGCSTQPIFRVYKNMEELAEDLFAKACDFFQEYYSGFRKQTVTPFVHLGNIYIKFAAEHKKLFAFIFLSENRLTGNPCKGSISVCVHFQCLYFFHALTSDKPARQNRPHRP